MTLEQQEEYDKIELLGRMEKGWAYGEGETICKNSIKIAQNLYLILIEKGYTVSVSPSRDGYIVNGFGAEIECAGFEV